MSFKLKKRIHEILDMDFETYAKFLRKEAQRASKFGVLDVVLCCDHRFSDGKISTLVLMGTLVGDLANFYKKNKTGLDFARGKCCFEEHKENYTLHILLEAGRAKADKINKVGRKLWVKTKLQPDFHKGKLPAIAPISNVAPTSQEEPTIAVAPKDKQVQIAQANKQYTKAKKALQTLVLPLLSSNTPSKQPFTNQHFIIAKAVLKANNNWLELLEDSSPELIAQRKKLQEEAPKLKRIAAKIKQALLSNPPTDAP